MGDLRTSRRPEAKSALMELLTSPDVSTRARAPRSLILWLRRKDARDDVVAAILPMLDYSEEEVRVSAARVLGETRDLSILEALFDVLGSADPGTALESAALRSISMVYGDGRRGGGELVRENLSLVVRGLKLGDRTAARNAVGILYFFKSPEAVKALEWAREHHPNQTIRDGAARRLGHLGH